MCSPDASLTWTEFNGQITGMSPDEVSAISPYFTVDTQSKSMTIKIRTQSGNLTILPKNLDYSINFSRITSDGELYCHRTIDNPERTYSSTHAILSIVTNAIKQERISPLKT